MMLALATGAAALALFAMVAEDIAGHETLAMDDAFRHWIVSATSPTLTVLARAASAMGSEVVAVLTVGLLVGFALERHWRLLALLVATVLGAQVLDDLLKAYFHRDRPTPLAGWLLPSQAYSFPSGHAMVSAAFYLFVAYLLWRNATPVRRIAVVALVTALVLAIGISRIYLEAHYPSDVLAGYAAGFLWGDGVLVGSQLLSRRTSPDSDARLPAPG